MDKQERIFKLVDKDRYVCADSSNRQTLTDNGIFVDGFYYYKGIFNIYGDLKPSSGSITTLIDAINGEFQYFEEVDSIPLTGKREELPNTFTKSMLVSGENVVETREGRRYLIAGDMLINLSGYEPLGSYEDNLEFKNIPLMSIDKVYSGRDRSCEGCLTESIKEYHAGEGFKDYINQENLTLIWQRESPEQAEKRIRKQELEEKVVALRQELKQAENELQEL